MMDTKTYRDLLPQEIQVFLAVLEAGLCGAEFGFEQRFGFREWVGEHDVCLLRNSVSQERGREDKQEGGKRKS